MTAALTVAMGQSPAWSGGEVSSAVRGILATAAVLGLLGVLAWLVRRGTIRLGPARGRQVVTVETAVSLGERRSLVVVSVEGRRLLLGLTPVQVGLVTELAPPPVAPAASFEQSLGASLEARQGGAR
jgi:flagellar biogenesis protein FliO